MPKLRREGEVARALLDVFVRARDEVDAEGGVLVEICARVLGDGGRDAEEGNEGGEGKALLVE